DPRQAAARLDTDGMPRSLPGPARRIVLESARGFRADILEQIPALEHVHALDAITNPENRNAAAPRLQEEENVESVPLRKDPAQTRMPGSAVESGIDVGRTPGQQQAVHPGRVFRVERGSGIHGDH